MYNVEQFIARAIESTANQSYENIEIICVDDCGSDRSVEIAKEFAVKDFACENRAKQRKFKTLSCKS